MHLCHYKHKMTSNRLPSNTFGGNNAIVHIAGFSAFTTKKTVKCKQGLSRVGFWSTCS